MTSADSVDSNRSPRTSCSATGESCAGAGGAAGGASTPRGRGGFLELDGSFDDADSIAAELKRRAVAARRYDVDGVLAMLGRRPASKTW